MAGQAIRGVRRYTPRAHPVSWIMLVITTLAIVVNSIDRIILPTVLPGIISEFNLSATEGGFLVSLSFVGTTIGAIVLGTLGDSLGKGPRRAWMWAATVAVVVVAAIGTAISNTLNQLRALRVLMGIGTGSMEPVNVTMVGEWWQKEDRGFAVGTHHTGFPIGQFVGPLLIGAIVAVASWREAFLFIPLIAIPIVILQIIVARRRNLERVNAWIEEHRMSPSVTVDEIETRRWENPFGRFKEALFSDRNVALGVMANFLFLWTETGVISFLTYQLTSSVGLTLATASVISGASGLTGWIGQVGWGTVSDHKGRKFSLYILAIGNAIALLAMVFITSAALAWVILIGWGLVRNSPYPVLYAAVIDTVPDAASSGLGLMIGIGLGASGILAPTVQGYLVDSFGFTAHYIVLTAICLLTLIPIALLHQRTQVGGGTRDVQAEG
jgi:MFS family permease